MKVYKQISSMQTLGIYQHWINKDIWQHCEFPTHGHTAKPHIFSSKYCFIY